MSRDGIYFAHILDAIDRIADFAPADKQQFLADLKTQDAIVRNPDVPWRDVAGMRDKMIHEYFGVDMDLVWDVITNDLPSLRTRIGRVASDLEE